MLSFLGTIIPHGSSDAAGPRAGAEQQTWPLCSTTGANATAALGEPQTPALLRAVK